MNLDTFKKRAERDQRLAPRFHAGIGMIQLFLRGKNERIHVWHPSLRPTRPGSDTHNHKFSFESIVLKGELEHHVVAVEPGTIYNLWHTHRTDEAELVDTCSLAWCEGRTLGIGGRYHFEAGRFHRSIPHGLVVTKMRKTWTCEDMPVMVVAKPDVKMDHAFDDSLPRPSTKVMWEALDDALRDVEDQR